MQPQFSKLGVFVKIMSRANSAKRGREAPDALFISTYSVPSGSRADLHDEARRAEFTDGMGWMDEMDARGIKSVLQFSSYFIGRYIENVYLYVLI